MQKVLYLSNITIVPKMRPHYDVGFIVVYEIILCLTVFVPTFQISHPFNVPVYESLPQKILAGH